MEVSSSPRADAQRHSVASHRTNVLVYRAIGAGRNESAAAEGTGMTPRNAAVLSMLQAIHAAAMPWWFKPPGPTPRAPSSAATASRHSTKRFGIDSGRDTRMLDSPCLTFS